MAEASTSPEVVLSHLDSLPTLPPIALRVLQTTADERSAADDVIRLIRNDQSLTAKVLSVANAAATGVRGSVTTLEKAVPLLGFNAVRSIVLATTVFDCFSRTPSDGHAFDRLEFWKHSLAVACAARRLARARRAAGLDPEDAFVAGLLHDIGKVALDTVFPKAYDRIAAQANQSRGDIADSERLILGADHTVAGRRLAERWRLPKNLQEVIWLHHLSPDTVPSSVTQPALIGVVQMADTVAREQRIGYSGNHMFYELSPGLAARLRFTAEDVAGVVRVLASDVAEHAALLGLDGETPETLYVKAMTRANAELGRLNADLLQGNQRLAAGARYFTAISEFERKLTDWSDPGAVVIALADAAAAALQRPGVAAFGVRQNFTAIDVCWANGASGERVHTTQSVPVELTAWLGTAPEQFHSYVTSAPPVVRTMLVGAFAHEDPGALWLLPIFHDQQLAGGIVYASDADERARLASEANELRSFLASLGLALGRANAQTAARRLSEDLAETNRRLQHMQVELLRSRTLSMIAEMAAGAGHELNGPLTVISGRAQMLGANLRDPDARRALNTIIEKAHECSGIVTELMDFARPRAPHLAPVDLLDLFAEARAELLERSKLTPAQLIVEVGPRGNEAEEQKAHARHTVWGDRNQLKTVLRELVHNAADAVAPEGGTITLRCQPAVEADAVEITVEDTGCGMTPAVLQRAFDPFYSHRNAGRSRGLGLARAYRIVESHGGRIWLESRPGEGTSAHIVIPRPPPAGATPPGARLGH